MPHHLAASSSSLTKLDSCRRDDLGVLGHQALDEGAQVSFLLRRSDLVKIGHPLEVSRREHEVEVGYRIEHFVSVTTPEVGHDNLEHL